jgi:DNA helicase-2/ATP-dependent DNA helicase PcrA
VSADRKYADLHIHSKFSRACSRDCDLEHLAWWAGRKGISVVGTGDFTHPVWREELGAKLVPDASGLFRLRPDLERAVHDTLPPACRTPVRFMLSSEISTIYKRDERTRKVHHLLYAPSLDAVDTITAALARVGNLAADGRPILGLDSRNLLEITLSGGDGCYLIPAHAWTPWFAVLGSQSGFDRVSDCYADLAEHIFAIETGLSSDPEMNWRVSSLDGYRLVSNSDAHSPPMLGREATAFELPELHYFTIYRALQTGDGFGGTVEFFPEEGKYHLDGHRACDVRMTPEETREAGGKCPACGKKPTIGVQHRVDALADRPEGYRPEGAAGFTSFVPLPEILGEIAGVGPKSKSVTAQVSALVERFGPELGILGDVPLDDLAAGAPSIVAEAITRLRRGEVRREAGYDGVYGTIRLFDPDELSGAALFDLPKVPRKPRAPAAGAVAEAQPEQVRPAGAAAAPAGLDPEQEAIVTHDGGPLLVVAGPGAGKTRVLTHAIAHRIGAGLPPEHCLAVTFTRRARDELRDRLTALLGADAAARVTVATFHGLGLLILRDQRRLLDLDADLKVADEKTRDEVLRSLSAGERPAVVGARIADAKRANSSLLLSPESLPAEIVRMKRVRSASTLGHAVEPAVVGPPSAGLDTVGPASAAQAAVGDGIPGSDADLADLVARYDAALRERGMVDLDDLVTLPTALLADDPSLAAGYRARWTDIFVDEYQDVDEQQYLMLRQLAAPGARICAIGDPDQAIYGFRGGDVRYFLRFAGDFSSTADSGAAPETVPGGLSDTAQTEAPAAALRDAAVAAQADRSAAGEAGGSGAVTTVRLSRSYRSAPAIVRAAMQLIRPGTLVPGRELIPARTDIPDGPVVVHAVADEREEAEAIAAEIEKLLGGASFHALDSRTVDGRDRTEHQLSFADFAVLYRTSSQAAAVGEALARHGFPYQRRAHSRLAEMPGVAAILAALTPSNALTPAVSLSPLPDLSPADGWIASPAIATAQGHPSAEGEAPEAGSVAERVAIAVTAALEALENGGGGDPAERAEAIMAIRTAADVLGPLAARCGADLDRFLDELALGAEVDTWDPRADRISLLTLHAAKGLEFPIVFIAGCDDGLLPLRSWRRGSGARGSGARGSGARGSGDRAEVDYDEERRLLFVGMTRATTRLTLFTAAKRTLRGEIRECSPSPFLSSIEPSLLDRRGGETRGRARRKARDQQTTLF